MLGSSRGFVALAGSRRFPASPIPATSSTPKPGYRLAAVAAAGGGTTITAGAVDALVLAGLAPSLRLQLAAGAVDAVQLSGLAPSLWSTLAAGAVDAVQVAGLAPALRHSLAVGAVDAVALAGLAPTLRAALAVGAVDALALSGLPPSLVVTTPGISTTITADAVRGVTLSQLGVVALSSVAASTRYHRVPDLDRKQDAAPALLPEVPPADVLFVADATTREYAAAGVLRHAATSTALQLVPAVTLDYVAASSADLTASAIVHHAPVSTGLHVVPPPRQTEFFAP